MVDLAEEPVVDVEDDEDDDGRGVFSEGAVLIAVAVVLALLVKSLLIQAFFIPSGSMEKTLHGCEGCQGDRVLVNKVVYKFRDIHRGEVVVFNGKGTSFTSEAQITPPKNGVDRALRWVQAKIGFGAPGDKDFIKRVIGVPGDVVACCTDGHVTVNGHVLAEPYVYLSEPDQRIVPQAQASQPQTEFDPYKVEPGHLFVMGDHRDNSDDSRSHGSIPEGNVVGRAFAVFWPYQRAKSLRVPNAFDPTALPRSPAAPPVLGFLGALPVTALYRRVRRARRRATD